MSWPLRMLTHEALIKLLSHKWKAELTVNGYRPFFTPRRTPAA